MVAVSDSGLGIMQTLRPSLQNEFPRLVGLSDIDLLVEVFRQGLSRHGSDRGCGLKGSAAKAMKFNAISMFVYPRNECCSDPRVGRTSLTPHTVTMRCRSFGARISDLPSNWGLEMGRQSASMNHA